MAENERLQQFTSFYLGGQLYGIDVLRVQEVTRSLPIARVPLAPRFVLGLINLRGQICTAVSLRQLFVLGEDRIDHMNVVCRLSEILIAFLVDSVGDVITVNTNEFVPVPETVPEGVRKFIKGVYKTPQALLSEIDLEKMVDIFINPAKETRVDSRI